MLNKINSAQQIMLVVHKNPDADSLGSASAMYHHLIRLGKKVTLYCATSPIDPKLYCIPHANKLRSVVKKSADLVIAFDCGSYDRLGFECTTFLINIDHHRSNNSFGDINIVDQDAISTATVLLRWFKDNNIELNATMATALYASISDDSLGFMSTLTDASTFKDTLYLIEHGANTELINQELFLKVSLSAMRLKSIITQSLELVHDAKIAFLKVTQDDLASSGARVEESDDLLYEAVHLPTALVAILIRQRKDGGVRVSLKSAKGVDVGSIAKKFGGGGHHFSAGFIDKSSTIEQIKRELILQIQRSI